MVTTSPTLRSADEAPSGGHYRHSPRTAFTLIELLVVVSIITVLMGLTILGIDSLRRASQRAQTQTILNVVATALETAGVEAGGAVTGVTHPFAGNARRTPTYDDQNRVTGYSGERPLFYREGVGALDTANLALRISDIERLTPALHGRVIKGDDRFADARVPHLFGMPRSRLNILASASELTSAYQTVAARSDETIAASDLDNTSLHPITIDQITYYKFGGSRRVWARADDLGDPPDTPAPWDDATTQAVNAALGSALERLADLRALRNPEPEAALIFDGRARAYNGDDSPGDGSAWEPGRIRDDGTWRAFALRGPTVIDAFGTEIIMGQDRAGRSTFLSAGPSGSFRVGPGNNGVLDTSDPFGPLSGDDVNASGDNITIYGER